MVLIAFCQSHLIWGIDHKAPAPEPVKLIGFSGQAPNDFESVGERIQAQQSQIAQGRRGLISLLMLLWSLLLVIASQVLARGFQLPISLTRLTNIIDKEG